MSCGPLCPKNPHFFVMDICKAFQKKRMLVVVGIPFFEIIFSMTPIGYHEKNVHKKTAQVFTLGNSLWSHVLSYT
jgi:hypothetical protein